MSRSEAIVVLQRLRGVVEALRDLGSDAPLHVVVDAETHIQTIEETAREIARVYGVTV